ncbi:RagB/SusD family nutrient uptake outer membrane protein [Larkinella soli]|uniref:RagB/SusD family nutrient uptake outer membrane protein n=1 Tax=Larkinella soli TaxID=1770527 RepID=UPI000FFBA755|nr:RagB/SusD family nutrient uptake outer membrane protein [Larkinella soli]
MKSLKSLTASVTIALLGVSYACNEKSIDLQPLSVTEAAYFKEEIDFERSILAVYAKLTDFYYFNANNPIHGVWQLPGDDITTTGTEAFEIFGTLQPANGKLNYYYKTSYQLINRANTSLQKIAEVGPGVYKTANLKNYHQGEALFLRGLMYFNLANFFGTAPLITERIQSTEQITQPNSKEGDLLDQAIKDFTEAAGLLPPKWEDANRGRATANSANGMLGKALVFRATIKNQAADYTAAIAAFNKITGASLVPDFGQNFDVATENNAESLFEFQATQPGFDNVWLSNDFNNDVGSTSAYWGWYENHYSLFGAAPYLATKKLQAAFDPKDPRYKLTMDSTRAVKKYVLKDQKTQSGVGSLNNARILRYADVLLLKAEAVLQSGGSTAEAVGLINQVRSRARKMVANGTVPADYATSETDKNRIFNWIMNERFLELAGEEGHRWFDLRRWHIGGKINLTGFNFSSDRNDVSISVPKNLYYPIPNNEIDLNPNIRQNAGY